MNVVAGTLYVVATPIGNLDDLTPRAREVLASVTAIAAEDTRRAAQLLTAAGVGNGGGTRLLSLHEQNEVARVPELLELLAGGGTVALITDAGTPLISDPGYRLLAAAREADVTVSPIPGPCAAIAALSVAGLPADRFTFEGFLPARTDARRARLAELAGRTETLVFHESVHRIGEMLTDLVAEFGSERPATVARELTKLHETIYRGTLGELAQSVTADASATRGEYTVVVAGNPRTGTVDAQELARVVGILAVELPASQAAALAARITGASRREAYQAGLDVAGKRGGE